MRTTFTNILRVSKERIIVEMGIQANIGALCISFEKIYCKPSQNSSTFSHSDSHQATVFFTVSLSLFLLSLSSFSLSLPSLSLSLSLSLSQVHSSLFHSSLLVSFILSLSLSLHHVCSRRWTVQGNMPLTAVFFVGYRGAGELHRLEPKKIVSN